MNIAFLLMKLCITIEATIIGYTVSNGKGDTRPFWPDSLSNSKTMPDYILTKMMTPKYFFPPLSCRLGNLND